jgi:hypothetical protein
MNNIKELEEMIQICETKEELNLRLARLNEQIKKNQINCKHNILVDFTGINNTYKNNLFDIFVPCKCLFCAAIKSQNPTSILIDVHNYLPQCNENNESENNNKFKSIQNLALTLMKENPNITYEELANQLNEIIQSQNQKNQGIQK